MCYTTQALTFTYYLFVFIDAIQVEFSPTLGRLTDMVNVLPQIVNTISEFKRLPELLADKQSEENPIYINIGWKYF